MLNRIDIKYFKLAIGHDYIGKESNVDINAKCPICGDSKRGNKKRLHLYYKNNITNINCFNGDCSCKNKTVYSFLEDFYPNLLQGYKREMFGMAFDNLKNEYRTDVFKNIEIKEESNEVITHDLTSFFKNIEDSPCIEYLKSRGIQYNQKYGKWYYGFQDLKIGKKFYPISDSIIVPLYYKDVMYGFYSRKLKEKTFCTYNPEDNIGYKIWNWFYIDRSKPVYIFEGIFDAISSGFDNIIASISAKIPQERLKELKEPIFVLDNDRTGLINSLQYAKMGYPVYIQPNEYIQKDINKLAETVSQEYIQKMINENLYKGIQAQIKIKGKL